MSLNASRLLDQIRAWASHLVECRLRYLDAARPYPVALLEQFKVQGNADDHTMLRNQLYFIKNCGTHCQLNLMDIITLSMRDALTEAARAAGLRSLGLLMDMGFDPNRYNGAATAVGSAGYSFQADVLQLFAARGADLCLSLAMEHAGHTGLGLTTLLHRLGQRIRPIDMHAPQAKQTVAFLAQSVNGSIQTDENGYTVLTDPLVPDWFKALVSAARATPVT